MIVKDITLFTDMRASFFGKYMRAAMAVLLVAAFLGLPLRPAAAYALEANEGSAEEQVAGDVATQAQKVYVYLQLSGDAATAAEELGLVHNNDGSQKWFTIGVIQLDIEEAASSDTSSILLDTEEVSDETSALKADIEEALEALVRFPDNEDLAIYGAQWKELKVCDGATDYPEADGAKAWHLDGELSVQLVKFEINYVDADGQPLSAIEDSEGETTNLARTLYVAQGSEMAASDYVVDVPGYAYSEGLTKDANGGSLVVKAESEALGQRVVSAADSLTLVYEKVSSVVPDPPMVGPVFPVFPPDDPTAPPDDPEPDPIDPADPVDPTDPGDQPSGEDDPNGSSSETPVPPSDDPGSIPEKPSENGGQQSGGAGVPSRPASPQVNVTAPQNPAQSQPTAQGAPSGAAGADAAFARGERTTVSVPAAPAEAAVAADLGAEVVGEFPVTEAVSIDDDVTPMVSRVAGTEAIAEEEIPMGAFDAPVDPAPWVAGMGAIGTALWGVVAVRRRLVMAQKLASFEGQVLGNAAEASADTAAVPNAGHQVL